MKIHIMYANFDVSPSSTRNWWKNRTKFGPIPGKRQMKFSPDTSGLSFFWGFGYV